MKRCTRCGEWLPLSEFYFLPGRQGHRYPQSTCKRCTNAKQAEYRRKRGVKVGKIGRPPRQERKPGEKATIECHRCRMLETCRRNLWKLETVDGEPAYWPLPCWDEHPATQTAAELKITTASIDTLEATP